MSSYWLFWGSILKCIVWLRYTVKPFKSLCKFSWITIFSILSHCLGFLFLLQELILFTGWIVFACLYWLLLSLKSCGLANLIVSSSSFLVNSFSILYIFNNFICEKPFWSFPQLCAFFYGTSQASGTVVNKSGESGPSCSCFPFQGEHMTLALGLLWVSFRNLKRFSSNISLLRVFLWMHVEFCQSLFYFCWKFGFPFSVC